MVAREPLWSRDGRELFYYVTAEYDHGCSRAVSDADVTLGSPLSRWSSARSGCLD